MSDEQSEGMEALNQSLNDHMEICALKQEVKRLEAKVETLTKAGDRMADRFEVTRWWETAKKYKQTK